MPIFALSILIQVALVIHILKTGRNTTWIWIVVMLPLAGSIAYLVLELLPDFAGTRTGRKTRQKIQTIVNPDKEIKDAAFDYSIANTIENTSRLAEGLINKGLFNEARDLYEKCLKGVHEHDPYLMYGLAKAEFGLAHYTRVKNLLDDLIKHNPDFKNPDAHLLYARTLEKLGDVSAALHEYESLDQYYPGPEATYHYAKLLQTQGNEEKAQFLLGKIVANSKRLGRHYNDIHREWIRLATSEHRKL